MVTKLQAPKKKTYPKEATLQKGCHCRCRKAIFTTSKLYKFHIGGCTWGYIEVKFISRKYILTQKYTETKYGDG